MKEASDEAFRPMPLLAHFVQSFFCFCAVNASFVCGGFHGGELQRNIADGNNHILRVMCERGKGERADLPII